MIEKLASTPSAAPRTELRQAAERFEAVFVRELIAAARKGKLADDVFGSAATDSYREMADARIADSIAAKGRFGIADMVERQLGGKAAR